MSAWFFMLGEPLGEQELRLAREYLNGLALGDAVRLESVRDWNAAAAVISNPEWSSNWWDAEQTECDRLRARASFEHGERVVLQALSAKLAQVTDTAHGAAAVEAARGGCSDPALIRAAAGAVGQALYMAELARLAGETDAHPFLSKEALFEGGHWPLCLVNGRFYVF
jgi:hypothetical protein